MRMEDLHRQIRCDEPACRHILTDHPGICAFWGLYDADSRRGFPDLDSRKLGLCRVPADVPADNDRCSLSRWKPMIYTAAAGNA